MNLSIRKHFLLLVFFSVLYATANSLVKIEGFPLTVQFGEYNFEKIIALFRCTQWKFGFQHLHIFRLTFIIDCLWATLFLTFFYQLLRRYFQLEKSKLMMMAIGLALLFDYWENLVYFIADDPKLGLSLHTIELLKTGFYAAVLILFIFYVLKYLIDHNYRLFKYWLGLSVAFLKYNFLSLFIIVLIFALLTQMGQGATVMVDLLMRPINLFFMFLLFFFLAIVLSHYPSYFRAILYKDQSAIKWHMERFLFRRFLGMGLVYFVIKHRDFKERPKLKIMRHAIGLAVLSVFIYILLYVGKEFVLLPGFLVPELAFVVFGLSVYVYNKLKKDGISHRFLAIVFGISIVLVLLSCCLAWVCNWHLATVLFSVVTIIALQLLYIAFRIRRHQTIGNVNFIKSIAAIGFFSLLFLIYINIVVGAAVEFVNPLLIILIYLINFYGLLMLVLKHMFFYWDNQNTDLPIRLTFNAYRYLLPTLVLSFLLWSLFVAPGLPSDLHQLKTEKITDSLKVNEEHYLQKLDSNLMSNSNQLYQVSSYGGGLKANLWTLLVLNKINHKVDNFIEHTMSMSGTSGGMLGIGNYATIYAKNHANDNTTWEKIIRNVGELNHLAVDITYLFGLDLLREVVPMSNVYKGRDRSAKSMEFYADLVGFENKFKQPYQTTFKEIFDSSAYFPPLLVNTFATSGTQGVALSIKSEYQAPGAINIINDTLQITYFGALSTSNRFPIFSPTANIKHKGHFLDGGYFDNSGLTSTLAFRSYVHKIISQDTSSYMALKSSIDNKGVKTIVINSAKTDYIKSLFNQYVIDGEGIREDAVGELSAIVTGITGLDKVPSYFEGVVEQTSHFFLPQPFDYQDVVNAYDGEPRMDPVLVTQIISATNRKIRHALKAYGPYKFEKWGIVAPALARLNSEPAVQYQFAMINCHKDMQKAIKALSTSK